MNILVVGFGSIGQRHLKNMLDYYPENSFSVLKFSQNKKVIQSCQIIENQTIYDYYKGVDFFYSLSDVDLKNTDAVFICNDANEHLDVAFECLKYDIDLFIEKPIDMDLNKVLKFKEVLSKTDSIAVIGYQSQFHPVFLKMKELINEYESEINYAEVKWANYMPLYHPYEDYKHRNSAKANLGGGVLLALSHEINTLNSMFPRAELLASNIGYSKTLGIDTEDISFSLLQQDDIKINFILGYSQIFEERYVKVQTTERYIIADYISNKVSIYNINGLEEELEFTFERNKLFLDELNYFFKCVKQRKVEFNNIDESIKDLELINSIKKHAKQ